mmetsp:Transcript_28665/g.80003  ORF Transcript_28665/g.80003 Transcript_28665/m.80003 type:complete len:110 (+) Transcript_28665:231-560(+)
MTPPFQLQSSCTNPTKRKLSFAYLSYRHGAIEPSSVVLLRVPAENYLWKTSFHRKTWYYEIFAGLLLFLFSKKMIQNFRSSKNLLQFWEPVASPKNCWRSTTMSKMPTR